MVSLDRDFPVEMEEIMALLDSPVVFYSLATEIY